MRRVESVAETGVPSAHAAQGNTEVRPGNGRGDRGADEKDSRAGEQVRDNGKLRDELLNREVFSTLAEAHVIIEWWRRHYNQVRPHSALGYRPPAPEAILPAVSLL